MCGRYALGLQRTEIRALPGYPNLEIGEWVNEDDFVPHYNIAPNSLAPVIRRCNASSPDLQMQTMRWGIPYGKVHAKSQQAINARSESIMEGAGMWNKYRSSNRCVVVSQGYYEWQTKGKAKLPHFTKYADGKVMLMAGLYHVSDETIPNYVFAIITTSASTSLSWLHDRQPVILTSDADVTKWLDTSSNAWAAELGNLLRPAGGLICYQVPKEVGKVGAESPTFIQPVAMRKDGIEAMFAKQSTKQGGNKEGIKRKRSPSPVISSVHSEPAGERDESHKTECKKLKVE
ncbi:uncharacterized protein BJ212DRAFT_1436834 [Suillus subaureus]|uniref:DUF159-domain-containing protein n=1 Tax=Suillus subaureus TaxID=48587 RepID=A0A9P7E0B4_9AGAM|nr:uncharacterized protein BJ212DRAFT_1436834 [Suillus subaureus]KAG1807795.1 hypothetical protein BJ212DRAFT_1436834 [Suillus subaureus]